MLAFRSDAELGLDNIWVMPWSSCQDAALRPHESLQTSIRPEILEALYHQTEDDALLNNGIKEGEDRKICRLVREGRLNGLCQLCGLS